MGSVPPPPPPPPPPPVQRTAQILPRGQRPAADRDNVERVRPAPPTKTGRAPFANVDNQTLLDAAKRLRPTQHNQSIQPRIQEQFLGRSNDLPVGGHRTYQPVDARLEEYQTGASLHAPGVGAHPSGPVGVVHEYSVPINQTPSNQHTTSYSSTSSTNYNFVPPPPPSQNQQPSYTSSSYSYSYAPPPPSHPPPPIPSQQQQQQQRQTRDFSYISRLANDFGPPSSHTIQQSSYQQPTNGNGIQTYKTYTSTTTRQVGGNSELPSNSLVGRNLIGNPKEYIHDFATRTPIAVLSPASQMTPLTASASNYSYTTTTTQRTTTPVQKPLSYAEELRNSTLTERQRQSNQHQNSVVPERQVPGEFHSLYEETTRNNTQSTTQQVDDLVRDMEMRMRTGRDVCAKCNTGIIGDVPGVTALGKPFHVNCFTCDVCQKQLAGCSFYNVDGKNLCQVDYMNSLEKCEKCATPITQKILRALGKPFHPECFVCPACQKSLDGIPFTVSKENIAYCLDCYHERFSPRCAACLKAIAPSGNETEVARVVALDKSFHVQCYVCEDCGLQLNSKIEGHACYPLESHLFCKNCNLKRLKAAT